MGTSILDAFLWLVDIQFFSRPHQWRIQERCRRRAIGRRQMWRTFGDVAAETRPPRGYSELSARTPHRIRCTVAKVVKLKEVKRVDRTNITGKWPMYCTVHVYSLQYCTYIHTQWGTGPNAIACIKSPTKKTMAVTSIVGRSPINQIWLQFKWFCKGNQ